MPSAAPKPRPSVPSIADVLSPKRVATPDQPCHGCRRSAIKSSRNLVMVTRKLRWEGKRSEEHTSELQSLMRISYAVFCLKKTITAATSNYYKRGSTLKTKTHTETNPKR